MGGELSRPTVEVLQKITTPAPTFVRPTLVPCVVGPAFEVINVLSSDGTVNDKAKYGAYDQIGKAITESSFPDPRGNIDELDVLEETVRPFMLASGNLAELMMNPGESFLCASHGAKKAAIQTTNFSGPTGLALVGKVLTLALDQPVRNDMTGDVTITFVGSGSNLTAQECADQINLAFGQVIATVVGNSPNDKVQITSPTFGALSSITVRAGRSANTPLQIGYSVDGNHEERVEGSGYRAYNDGDADTISPWIEYFVGDYILDGVSTNIAAKAGLVDLAGTFASALSAAVTFGSAGTVPVKIGDYVFADGVQVKAGEITKVELNRFRIGSINTLKSVADANGRYISKVYNTEEVGTLTDVDPFAPVFVFFKATGLDWELSAPTAAALTGSAFAVPAQAASVLSGAVTVPAVLGALRIHYVVTVDGVETDDYFTFGAGPFTNLSDVVAAINIPGVTASASGTSLKLATTKTGRNQALIIKSDGSANAALNFSTSADASSTGVDAGFFASLITTSQNATTVGLNGKILNIQTSTDNGSTWSASVSHTFASPANLAAVVDELNADAVWAAVLQAVAVGTELQIWAKSKAINGIKAVAGTALGAGAGSIALTADAATKSIVGLSLKFTFDDNPRLYDISFSDPSIDLMVDEINALVGATVASASAARHLVLTSPLKGKASKVAVSTSGTGQATVGLSTTPTVGTGRPYPDAYLDDASVLHIGSQILRDKVTGYPLNPLENSASLYVQFKALRRDVSPMAQEAGVLRIGDQDTLLKVLDPLTEENPLGLAFYMAMINAPQFEVKGLGVDEVSGAAPEGTVAAYARAAALLEAEEVYALAPLSQDDTVHGLWMTHALAMSEPEQGGERIVFFNKKMPTRKVSKIAASGSQANSTAVANQMLLDVNPAQGLLDNGVNPGLPITVAMGVYMEFEVDGELVRYNVSSVSGALANFRLAFTGSENLDGFYATSALPSGIVNAPYALKVRGSSLVIPGSNPPIYDYSLMADTVSEANESFKNRRAFSVFPDTVKMNVKGIEKSLPGYYACAAIAGMVASKPPQQGFTNYPMTGLTGVVGTEKFSKKQLNIMAGGGTYILMQEVQGGAVFCRHQLSTDVGSVETRELSITKVVDFVAKILRLTIRRFIGTNNITKDLIDSIGTTINAVLKFLEEAQVLNGSNLNNIIQDTKAPDTLLVDVTLDVPYPCNYIRIVLAV